MNKSLIVANWKMNPIKVKEAEGLFSSVKKEIKGVKNAEVVICPPFIYLKELSSFNNKGSSVPYLKIGAQNCFWQDKGAYTGEVSVAMLKDLGCQYVIVGHSERRKYFQETDEAINKKIKAVLAEGLNSILCVGETEEEREQNKTEQILHQEITTGLKEVSFAKTLGLIIAYEPIWAIGTGNACDPEEAQGTGLLIRKIISKTYNLSLSKKIKILYGGSVNSKNAKSYLDVGFQGLLVGGASLDPKEFIDLVRKVC